MPVEFTDNKEMSADSDSLRHGECTEWERQSILILVGQYLPGFKAGGPLRSIANLVDALGEEFKFKVVTTDRDLGDSLPYSNIKRNCWIRVGKAEVMYLLPGWRGLFKLFEVLRTHGCADLLYLNSFFSRRFSIFPIILRRLGIIEARSWLLAPRGEFSSGALNLKKRRKSIYVRLARWTRAYQGVSWHASSDLEAADILRIVGNHRIDIAEVIPSVGNLNKRRVRYWSIGVAEDIARPEYVPGFPRRIKISGRLNIVFVSRISPMKNLIGALTMLKTISGDVSFTVYGPTEDRPYWEQCQKVIDALPSNVQVDYKGIIEHDKIASVFAQSDLFLFPTLGENYGHVICEALGAGCPVLISDQTPWRNLAERSAGWDIPLEEIERFRDVLQQCVDGDEVRQAALSAGARSLAVERASPRILDMYRALLHRALSNNDTDEICEMSFNDN